MHKLIDDFLITFVFLGVLFGLLMFLTGCATQPKTETGALSCRGTAFAINPAVTVQAEVRP